MNPKGKWVFRNIQQQFVNEDIMAIYGIVYQVDRNKFYWEARTGLETRIKGESPYYGYAKTEEGAMTIVETLLKFTETVEFE